MNKLGDERVVTTDHLVHVATYHGNAHSVLTPCNRFVSLQGLGHPEARKRGMEGGWLVTRLDVVTCLRCWSEALA